jgi:release factor glutamine methyltransferase
MRCRSGPSGALDVVVANPPYVAPDDELPAEVADWEPRLALVAGDDGYAALHELVDVAATWLRPGGVLVLEMAPRQTGPVADRARAAGFAASVHPDLAGRPRAVVARRPG